MRITEVEVSGRLALACGGCGELILFLGRDSDWFVAGEDGRPRVFPCGGCYGDLTPASRVVPNGDGGAFRGVSGRLR